MAVRSSSVHQHLVRCHGSLQPGHREHCAVAEAAVCKLLCDRHTRTVDPLIWHACRFLQMPSKTSKCAAKLPSSVWCNDHS